jgi:hypothetical protein
MTSNTRVVTVVLLLVAVCAYDVRAEAPKRQPQKMDLALLAVEKDQVEPYTGAGNLEDSNLLLGRNTSYAHCSSYRPGCFAHYIQDGDMRRGWQLPDSDTQGWVDASLGLPVVVDKIVVREAGDRIRAYELKVYDGSEWRRIATGTALGSKAFRLEPMPVSAVRIDITTTGGGGISEVEVYNTADPDRAFPEGPSAPVREAFVKGRVAILLGSPLALSGQGVEYINPREHAARPLPDSGRYLPETMSFLLQRAGGEGHWDGTNGTFTGTCNENSINFSISNEALQTREQIAAVLEEFGKQAGLPCSVYPDFPFLLLFGDSLPEDGRIAILSEVRECLARGGGVVRFARGAVNTQSADAVVRPTAKRIGKTMKWVGARTGGMEKDTNNSAWFSYYRPNAVRTWYGYKTFRSYIKMPEVEIASLDEFEELKAALRLAPEASNWMLWDKLLASDDHKAMAHEFAVYRKYGAEIVNQTGAKHWPDDWASNFRYWVVTYMATYYLAKHYDVAVHQYGNEPDWYFRDDSDEQIAFKLQLQADAITSAIEDVNRLHGKELEAQYAAPVLASDPCSRIARVMMRNLRTDYRGRTLDRDLVQFYNRHRYSGRARQNVSEVHRVHDMMLEESVTGKALPQIFTELNYATGRHWAAPHMTVTSDSPEVIHSMASIWGQMMAAQHVCGIFLFKLNADNPRWSNVVCPRFFRESDSGPARSNTNWEPGTDIGNVTKNAEILRLFAEGFAGEQDLLQTRIRSGDLHYQAYTSYNADRETYYLWTVQVNERADSTVELDLSGIDVAKGTPVIIKEVSAAKFGEVVFNSRLPASRKIVVIQPRASAWLISVPKARKMTEYNYGPVADTTVWQGKYASENCGLSPKLQVRRHSNPNRNRISFIKFAVDGPKGDIHRALLRLHGKRVSDYVFDESTTFRVYGVTDDTWQELQLTGVNAPAICRTVSATKRGSITLSSPPVGHMSFTGQSGFSEIDVTNFVREHGDNELTFLLIRELKWPGEDTDFAGVELTSREGGGDPVPRLQVLYRTKK